MTNTQLSPYSERIKTLVDNSGKSLRKISLEIQRDIDPKFGVKNLQKILSRSGVEPRLSTLVILAEYFRVPLEYFIYGTISHESMKHTAFKIEKMTNNLTKKSLQQCLSDTATLDGATSIVNDETKKLNDKIRLQNLKEQLGFEFD